MVNIDTVVDMFENCNNNFDEKELGKLRSLGGSDQKISKYGEEVTELQQTYINKLLLFRSNFIEFCKTSVTVRSLIGSVT